MKKFLGVSLMIMSSLTMASLTPSYAQAPSDAPAPAAALDTAAAAAAPVAAAPVVGVEEDKFSFGKVVSVVDKLVTIKEYDFTKDADVETAYAVSAETELGNINAIADLKVGDDIVIDYVERGGKRVITTLVKEEKGTEALPGGEGDAAAVPAAVPVAETAPSAETGSAQK